jgi:anti-sigma factor RsiW
VNADHESLRLLLGGYLLGGLDAGDQDRLDAHLADCATCRDELDRLAPVPELLQRLPAATQTVPAGARPSPERIDGLLRRMRAQQASSRRARWGILAGAAAVVAVVAVGAAVYLPSRGDDPGRSPILTQPTVQAPTGQSSEPLVTARFVAADGGPMAGEAILTPKTWGVSVALDLSSLPGDGPFTMQIRDAAGGVEQAACWGRTPSGRARVTGASSMQLPSVRAVVVADEAGKVLGTAVLT